MAESNHDDDDLTSTDPEPPVSNSPAKLHRKLGTAGVRLNESHAHLSALRSASYDDSDTAAEIAEAEGEALVRTLEDAQEQLEEAIDLAIRAVEEVDGTDETRSAKRAESDDCQPDMLWNTTGSKPPSVPFGSR